jgi:hypothetical protein
MGEYAVLFGTNIMRRMLFALYAIKSNKVSKLVIRRPGFQDTPLAATSLYVDRIAYFYLFSMPYGTLFCIGQFFSSGSQKFL